MPILIKKDTNISQFIKFWSDCYPYDENKENLYINNINQKDDFTNTILLSLFEWKNGLPLSKNKKESIEKKILIKIEIINDLKKKFDLEIFEKEFKKVSLIWKVFLLHIINPDTYPIFDQHVLRAMRYIKSSKIEEITYNDTEKKKIYFNEYINFFNKIKLETSSNVTNKKIDEALWSFGKFLKSNYKKMI